MQKSGWQLCSHVPLATKWEFCVCVWREEKEKEQPFVCSYGVCVWRDRVCMRVVALVYHCASALTRLMGGGGACRVLRLRLLARERGGLSGSSTECFREQTAFWPAR